MEAPSLTIRNEEELPFADPTSQSLDSCITHLTYSDRTVLREQATSGLLQSVLEVTSPHPFSTWYDQEFTP